MDQLLRAYAGQVAAASIQAVQPDEAVARALKGKEFPGWVLLVAAGKAAWQMAKAAAPGIAGLEGAAVFSVGSDGTDGPTDAAGGYVDGDTLGALRAKGLDVSRVLADNDAYHALKAVDGLIFTGPTGTNVNDVAVALLRK